MAAKPNIKLVEGKEKQIDTREYLEQVVATDTLPHRDRMAAALGLMPFKYPRAEGRYLGFQWDEPAPKTLEQAISQTQKIIELERQGVINNVDATTLHDRISRISQLIQGQNIGNGNGSWKRLKKPLIKMTNYTYATRIWTAIPDKFRRFLAR
jgi:hypothetical protein